LRNRIWVLRLLRFLKPGKLTQPGEEVVVLHGTAYKIIY